MRIGLAMLRLCTLIGLALIAMPSSVHAQGWLADRTLTQGPGFRLGDFELHPGVGVELGYDSNLYFTQDSAPPCSAASVGPCHLDSAILRATAHLNFSSRGSQRQQQGEAHGAGEGGTNPTVTFQGGLNGSFYHFFNATDRTNMDAAATFALSVLPGRSFSFDVLETFGRSIRPFTEQTSTRVAYGRLTNDAGINFNFQTHGGVFLVRLGYLNHIDFFESSLFQYGDRMQHTITLTESYRFLPQTALVHQTQVGYLGYLSPVSAAGTPNTDDGLFVRSQVGINGAITNDISLQALVGYGAGFFFPRVPGMGARYTMNYESIVGQAQIGWQITPGVRLAVGYNRDFQGSFIGNFYRVDRGFVNYSMVIGGVFLLTAGIGVGYYDFGSIIDSTGMMLGTTLNRADVRFDGTLFGEYRFTNWLGVNATFVYNGNFTDYNYVVAAGATTFIDPAQYNKVQLWLGVRVFY